MVRVYLKNGEEFTLAADGISIDSPHKYKVALFIKNKEHTDDLGYHYVGCFRLSDIDKILFLR